MTEAESQALVKSIGEHSAMHFGKENLSNLAVSYSPAYEHADILVATRNESPEAREAIYKKYIEEIIPLYAEDATLTLRFFHPDAEIFSEMKETSKAKSFVMA